MMKKKISILVFSFLTTLMFSQQVTDSGKAYTEVVKVDLKKDVIYQKLREWISLNYKDSKEVIQLVTKEKLITKGNAVFNYLAGKHIIKYRVSITMEFSIKDNKYKIDFTPTKIVSDILPDTAIDSGVYEILMTNEVLSKENYLVLAKEVTFKQYLSLGYSVKKSKKMLTNANKYIVKGYDSYKLNKQSFEKQIKNIYDSIKNSVNKKEDW